MGFRRLAKNKECVKLVAEHTRAHIAAPTGRGFGFSTLSRSNSRNVVSSIARGVADFTILTGPSATYIAWYYWSQSHNSGAQVLAKTKYCATYPNDWVCKGQDQRVYYIVDVQSYLNNRPFGLVSRAYVYGPVEGLLTVNYNWQQVLVMLQESDSELETSMVK